MKGLDGLQLQQRLLDSQTPLPVVFVSGHGDVPSTVRAIKSGAEDFLLKPVVKADLIAAIQRAFKRYEELQQQVDRLASLRRTVDSLTPRQRQVYLLFVRGKLNKQIAHELGTSVRTIKAHRHKIMQKLQVRSVAEAVSLAEKLGLLAIENSKQNSK
jgi:RNA polymerase sigma factor (sigma-70 family)